MLSIKANNDILCGAMQYWYFQGFIAAASGGRRTRYPQGLLQAVELRARSVVSAGAAQWQTHRPETYRDEEHTGALLEKRNKYMRLWGLKKKKKKAGRNPPEAPIYSLHDSRPNPAPPLCRHPPQGSSFDCTCLQSWFRDEPNIVLS